MQVIGFGLMVFCPNTRLLSVSAPVSLRDRDHLSMTGRSRRRSVAVKIRLLPGIARAASRCGGSGSLPFESGEFTLRVS